MHILVTNDDGINSKGIFDLVTELKKIGQVTVVAPDGQRSACGHALTIENALRVKKFYKDDEFFGYAVNGMPSDCVKLALNAIMDTKPDIVVSGINHGQNTSQNIFYSGTAAAASEGMLAGIPSMAVSVVSFDTQYDCRSAAIYAAELAAKLPGLGMPKDTFLNMNIPSLPYDEIKGTEITHLSDATWKDAYEKRRDPFGREYYWFSGEYISADEESGSDDWALSQGKISVSPIRINFTNSEFANKLKSFKL